MKRWRCRIALLLISIFLVSTITVHAERLEHEETNTILENNDSSKEIIVDKYDDKYYSSIQDAINSAATDSTIYIKNGYYNEILNIKKKINIIGEDKEKTIINPTTQKNSYAIRIAAEGVKISNLGVQNHGPGIYSTGIKVSARDTTISNCDIFDTPVGIAVWSSDNTITNCRFWGCEDEGIAFLGSSSNQCNNNIVTNCEFFNNCDGIELQYSSNNVISNCKFYDNTHAGIDAIGESNDNNIITDCDFSNNKAFGVFFSRSIDNTISKCAFSESKIMATASKQIKVEECKLDGIYLIEQSSMTIKDCSNVIESKIKTVDSDYVIYNIDNIKSRFESFTINRDNIKNSIFSRIMTILSIIRLK